MAEFTNQASLRYNNTVTNSNIVVGNLVQALEVTKTAVRTEYSSDDDTIYVISIRNSGTTPYNGLTVTDDLGAYQYNTTTLVPLDYADGSLRYFINGELQPEVTPTAGSSLTVTGISVPAGGSTILVYETHPNIYAPLDAEGEITNTVTVTGTGIGEALTDKETISAAIGAQLTISKAINPSTITANGQVTYTFVIQNIGNKAADEDLGAVVEDTFEPRLADLRATFNGGPLTLNTDYTYDQATGVFATTPGTVTVPAAQFSRNERTGAVEITPSVSVLTVTGTI